MALSSPWRDIGAVTVKSLNDSIVHYADLQTAVRAVGGRAIAELKKGRLMGGPCWFGDTHVFLDQHGLVIPVWRVQAEAQGLPDAWSRWYSRRFRNYDHERDYRRAPVPCIGGRHRYGNSLRYMATQAERRANDGMLHDDEMIAHGLAPRPRRVNLPTVYDDVCRPRLGHSWKHHRRTQYRIKD